MNYFYTKHHLVKLLFISLAVVFSSCIALVSDKGENSYKSFRAEGLSLEEAAPSAISYLRKYINKSWITADSAKVLFEDNSSDNE
jgi:hypothetical protein